MAKRPVTVSPETPLWELVAVLVTLSVDHVVVVDGGRVVGVIGRERAFQALREDAALSTVQ